MKTNQISASQFLMNFLGVEQMRMTERMSASTFSDQMAAEQMELSQGTFGPLSAEAEGQAVAADVENPLRPLDQTRAAGSKGPLGAQTVNPLAERRAPAVSAESQASSDTETPSLDPALTDRVLTRLQASPETRKKCLDAESSGNEISVQELALILNEGVKIEGQLLAQSQVSGAEVRALLESLRRPQTSTEGNAAVEQLKVKLKKSYNMKELRNLVNQIATNAQQKARPNTEKAGSNPVQGGASDSQPSVPEPSSLVRSRSERLLDHYTPLSSDKVSQGVMDEKGTVAGVQSAGQDADAEIRSPADRRPPAAEPRQVREKPERTPSLKANEVSVGTYEEAPVVSNDPARETVNRYGKASMAEVARAFAKSRSAAEVTAAAAKEIGLSKVPEQSARPIAQEGLAAAFRASAERIGLKADADGSDLMQTAQAAQDDASPLIPGVDSTTSAEGDDTSTGDGYREAEAGSVVSNRLAGKGERHIRFESVSPPDHSPAAQAGGSPDENATAALDHPADRSLLEPQELRVSLDSQEDRPKVESQQLRSSLESAETHSKVDSQQDRPKVDSQEARPRLNGQEVRAMPDGQETRSKSEYSEVDSKGKEAVVSVPDEAPEWGSVRTRLTPEGLRHEAADGDEDGSRLTVTVEGQQKEVAAQNAGELKKAAATHEAQGLEARAGTDATRVDTPLADVRMNANPATSQTTQESLTTGTLSLNRPDWPQQLIEQFRRVNRSGQHQWTLQLEPKNLGRVVLKLKASNDELAVHIATETGSARSVLLENASMLKQELEKQGLVLSDFSVDVSKDNGNRFSEKRSTRSRRTARVGMDREASANPALARASHNFVYGTEQSRINLLA